MSDEAPQAGVTDFPGDGGDVAVGWEQARAANRLTWDDRASLHESLYGLDAFEDPAHLSSVVRDDLAVLEPLLLGGSVRGLDVLHLQCHIGSDTVSLARRGARVTGLDFSSEALTVAGRLARSTHADVRWIQSDVLAAASATTERFDVVYTSIGVLCWLEDLGLWAEQVRELLRPGGLFFVRDGHPMLYALDESADELRVVNRYFANGRAQTWDDGATYAGEGTTEHTRTFEYPHSLAEILGALLAAGLEIVLFDEGRTLPWRFSSLMVEREDGYVFPEPLRDRIPCTFTVVARRRG